MKKIFQISIIILSTLFAAQAQTKDALTISHNCDPNCLDLTINGGYPTYDVEWQIFDKNTSTWSTVTGWPKNGLEGNNGMEDLCEPTGNKYKVIVHDALCGEVELEYEIDLCKCAKLQLTIESITNVTSCGAYDPESGDPAYDNCDGSATVSISGANNYSINWSNGQTGLSASGYCTGSYSVTVYDDKGCSVEKNFEICCCQATSPTYPPSMCTSAGSIPSNIIGDIISPTSATAKDGTIVLNIANSTGLIFTWSGPNGFKSNSQNISSLSVGTYCVKVSNGCGGYGEKCFILKDCSSVKIELTASVVNTCQGINVGNISVSANGGANPYQYNWQNNSINSSITDLGIGTYCLTVTDLNGCQKKQCFNVDENDYEIKRIICKEEYYCNGQFIGIKDIGVKSSKTSEFCVTTTQCVDGKIFVLNDFAGVFYDGNDCRVFTKCKDGSKITLGFGEAYYIPTADCRYEKHCVFYVNNILYDLSPGTKAGYEWCRSGCIEEGEDCLCLMKKICLITGLELESTWVECTGIGSGEPYLYQGCDELLLNPKVKNEKTQIVEDYLYDESIAEINLDSLKNDHKHSRKDINPFKKYSGTKTKVLYENNLTFDLKINLNEPLKILVSDLNGKIINVPYNIDNESLTIQFKHVPMGAYFLNISSTEFPSLTFKIIKPL